MPLECGFHLERSGSALLVDIGPVVRITIGLPEQADHKLHNPQFHSGSMDAQALIDTGAKNNHIDDVIAKTLDLPIINKRFVSGSNGEHEVNVYLAQIKIPTLQENIYGQFLGVKLVEAGSRHGALLGRSFLQKVRMSYNGLTGQVTLTRADERMSK